MAHIPISEQTALSGKAFKSYYIGCAPNYRGGILLYNPTTQRTIIRRSFKVIGDNEHTPLQLHLHSPPPDSTEIYHENDFGTDDAFDFDPSDLPLIKHQALIPDKIPSEEFVVEKILGHKGSHNRPSSMKFLVKWLGYDHSHNSWLPWSQVDELAAMDTYERNNPDVQFPASKSFVSAQDHAAIKNNYPLIDKSSVHIPSTADQARKSDLAQYWTAA